MKIPLPRIFFGGLVTIALVAEANLCPVTNTYVRVVPKAQADAAVAREKNAAELAAKVKVWAVARAAKEKARADARDALVSKVSTRSMSALRRGRMRYISDL